MIMWVFRREVGWVAAQDLQAALQVGDTGRAWYSMHGLLSAARNVSRLLWPSKSDKVDVRRRAALRGSLAVDDDSPIRSRAFRNHFEHFDERLERWANSSERKNLADSNIMRAGAIEGIDPKDFLRSLDPETMVLSFRGYEYAVRPVFEAIETMREKAREYEMPPWARDRRPP